MKRLLLVVVVALAAAASASAGQLPDATTPNLATVLVPQLLVPPAQPQQLSYDQLLPIWQAAGQAYGVPWSVLAAINKVETGFGQNMGPSSAGAIGWMQFMPDTWARWGTDANGDGVADPWNAEDAIYSAARYLAATGGTTDIRTGVFAYNHAQWYVDEVMQLAQQYDAGGTPFATALDTAQQQLGDARRAVLDANGALLAAQGTLAAVSAREDRLLARAQTAGTLTERLTAQKAAVLLDYKVQDAQANVQACQADLDAAQRTLDAARNDSSATAFAPGAGAVLQTPTNSGSYVFPVAGGPGVVHVGHTHHDYPAADIGAPEGTQLYALANGTVVDAWPGGDARCGIGFTIATFDGLTWTYCHMSYLEPAVTAGATLSAGQPVGLVGHTGHADGPHLHLQLQPASGYPQDEAWFQSFAGSAFSWSDSVQTNAAPDPTFAVVGGTPAPDAASTGDTAEGSDAAAPRTLESASTAGAVVYFTASGA
jgi:murein DD-endopeptidase MepM/ murein hydrolase activator NlpD